MTLSNEGIAQNYCLPTGKGRVEQRGVGGEGAEQRSRRSCRTGRRRRRRGQAGQGVARAPGVAAAAAASAGRAPAAASPSAAASAHAPPSRAPRLQCAQPRIQSPARRENEARRRSLPDEAVRRRGRAVSGAERRTLRGPPRERCSARHEARRRARAESAPDGRPGRAARSGTGGLEQARARRRGCDAAAVARHLWRPEAPLLVHLAHGDGHLVVEGQDAAPSRDLQVHRRQVPLLQEGHAPLAELAAAQPFLQRLLHQGTSRAAPPRQGRLLGAAPGRAVHVRERQPAAPAQALQAAQARQGPAQDGAAGAGLGDAAAAPGPRPRPRPGTRAGARPRRRAAGPRGPPGARARRRRPQPRQPGAPARGPAALGDAGAPHGAGLGGGAAGLRRAAAGAGAAAAGAGRLLRGAPGRRPGAAAGRRALRGPAGLLRGLLLLRRGLPVPRPRAGAALLRAGRGGGLLPGPRGGARRRRGGGPLRGRGPAGAHGPGRRGGRRRQARQEALHHREHHRAGRAATGAAGQAAAAAVGAAARVRAGGLPAAVGRARAPAARLPAGHLALQRRRPTRPTICKCRERPDSDINYCTYLTSRSYKKPKINDDDKYEAELGRSFSMHSGGEDAAASGVARTGDRR